MSPAAEKRSKPYEKISAFYDEMMSHVDYMEWQIYVREVWFKFRTEELKSCLDAACGTGRFLESMRPHVSWLYGTDSSASMLAIAADRLSVRIVDSDELQRPDSGAAQNPGLYHIDLRRLKSCEKLDLVTCLYDSINYLLTDDDFVLALRRMAECLNPQGMLVFDVCTKRNSIEHFLDMFDSGNTGNWKYERHSWYDADSSLHHNDFRVSNNVTGHGYSENHLQRIYSVRKVESLINKAGLQLLARYADFGFKRGGESADRVHFVCSLAAEK
jgi:SAM-dependent methyltransferase